MFGWVRGDRVGVFSPAKSIYFTARLKAFSLNYYEPSGDFIVNAEFEPISRDPIYFADSTWEDWHLILWSPWSGLDAKLRRFDPQKYDSVYSFKAPAGQPYGDYAPDYDAREKLNVALKKMGLPEVPNMLNPIAQAAAPCSPERCLNYQKIVAPFVTDSSYGYHDIIVLTSGRGRARGEADYDSLLIVAVVTNSEALNKVNQPPSEWRWTESVDIRGVVDLDFDGEYELVVVEESTDTTIYSSTTYVVRLISGKPTRSKPWKSEGGC